LIKLFRFFCDGYHTNLVELQARGYKNLILPKRLIIALNENQGFGQIKGTSKKVGANYSPVPVCVFRRDNRQLLWETTSRADGSYAFRNIAKGLECFVVAFDPNDEYNAVISDKVVAK